MATDTLQMSEEKFNELSKTGKVKVRKDWTLCPLSKWNATTARSYLQCLTQHRFKMDYISDNIRQENAIISQFIKQYGREVLKEFIRDCVKNYNPTKQYPIVTFGFMYTYQRKHILPAIIKKRQTQEERLKELEAQKGMEFTDHTEVF